jgi:hypothetical protein
MSERPAGQGTMEPRSAGHEVRDVVFRPVLTASIGLLVLILVALGGMRVLFSYLAAREAASSPPANPLAAELRRSQPPGPRLQAAPIEDLHRFRTLENAFLNGYSWVDRDAGTVRIPIDRAMDLLVQKGLPARGSGPVSPSAREPVSP